MVANAPSDTPKGAGTSRIVGLVMWVLSIGLLLFLIISLVIRFATPVPLYRLRIVQDVPLPGVLAYVGNQNPPLVPGQAVRFDHFDFQALDSQTHLLFINHSGPVPDKLMAVDPTFKDADAVHDGNVVVFDTVQRKVVKLLDIPQTAGIVVAPDIHWVYTADAQDDIIYGIDESTFRIVKINLSQSANTALDSPDAMAYDQVDHRLFVSDPGMPDPNSNTMNIPLVYQNVAVINVLNNTLIGKIPLGMDKPSFGFGYDVGHVQYDITSHRVFVVTLPLHDQDALNPDVTPPSFVDVIDPTLPMPRVVSRINLPDTCLGPHGMVVDSDQEIGFVVCIESENLLRINLRTLQPFPDATLLHLPAACDIARLDHPLHVLFIGCTVGIAMFNEAGGQLTSLGSQFVGGNNHTVFINEATQEVYLPIASVSGRPVLRILQYDPNGTEPGT